MTVSKKGKWPTLLIWLFVITLPIKVAYSLVRIADPSWVRYPVWQHTFVSPSAFSRRAVVSYWRKYVHEVLVNRLGGLSLPRKSVVRLTDRPDMTLDVYRGRKITIQQQYRPISLDCSVVLVDYICDKAGQAELSLFDSHLTPGIFSRDTNNYSKPSSICPSMCIIHCSK